MIHTKFKELSQKYESQYTKTAKTNCTNQKKNRTKTVPIRTNSELYHRKTRGTRQKKTVPIPYQFVPIPYQWTQHWLAHHFLLFGMLLLIKQPQ
jgi:hypothetical protein